MSQQKPNSARARPRRATVQSKATLAKTKDAQAHLPALPAPDDREGWKTYWKQHQQPWRTEPEINMTRQQELAACYAVTPDWEQGVYPFCGMKLSRADVEWLLATYGESFIPERGLDVRGANLNEVDLSGLSLVGLRGGFTYSEMFHTSEKQREAALVQMNKVYLNDAQLQGAQLWCAQLRGARLDRAQLQGANLNDAQLQDAWLWGAQLQGAHLIEAHLQGAVLNDAQLQDAFLNGANLQGAHLHDVVLANPQGIGPQLGDVQWEDVNLAVIDWSQIKILGNEQTAQQKKDRHNNMKSKEQRIDGYRKAVRANRQLAVALQAQGLNEEAARFAYRANVLQRKVLWFQMIQPKVSLRQRGRQLGTWVFSRLLDLMAGYGYKPGRSFLAYLLVIVGFMGLYLLTSHFTTPHLRWDEALVLSLSSFHGRGFFPQTITLGDPYARLAVTEAVLGLFIEISLIATFTQRFLGK